MGRHVLENGPAALQVNPDEIQVKLFASQQQFIMQLYCSKHLNNAFRFFWKAMGLAYANPPFSLLGKLLTKIAYEGRVVMCTPDWGCSGEHAYWLHAAGSVGGRFWGGWPATVVRGAWCQALSLPLPPILWNGQQGFRDPCVPGAVSAGVGTQHRPHSVRPCGPALLAVGVAEGRPRGGCLPPL